MYNFSQDDISPSYLMLKWRTFTCAIPKYITFSRKATNLHLKTIWDGKMSIFLDSFCFNSQWSSLKIHASFSVWNNVASTLGPSFFLHLSPQAESTFLSWYFLHVEACSCCNQFTYFISFGLSEHIELYEPKCAVCEDIFFKSQNKPGQL